MPVRPRRQPAAHQLALSLALVLMAGATGTAGCLGPTDRRVGEAGALWGSPQSRPETQQDNRALEGDELRGRLRVRVVDDRKAGTVRRRYRLVTESADEVELRFAGNPRLPAGLEATFRGHWLAEGVFSVDDWRRAPRHKRLNAPLVREPMRHAAAVLVMQDVAMGDDRIRGHMNVVSEYFAETSHGVDTFRAEVFRYDIQPSEQDCTADSDGWGAVSQLIFAFDADGHSVLDYDHIVAIVSEDCGSDWNGSWGELGAIMDDGTLSFERLTAHYDAPGRGTDWPWWIAHELGHNLGMDHSDSADCGGDLYREGLDGCMRDEYGDHNDVMGWGGPNYWSTPHERFMGWIEAEHVVTAHSTGLYNLQPSDAAAGCGIQALRVPIEGELGFYFYLEYRRARGDSQWAGTGLLPTDRNSAVLLYRSRDDQRASRSTRIELGTSAHEGARVAERYDLGNGIAIEVASMEAYARLSLQVSAQGETRDDNGNVVVPESDGSFGTVACGEQSAGPPSDDTAALDVGDTQSSGGVFGSRGCASVGPFGDLAGLALLLFLGIVRRRMQT